MTPRRIASQQCTQMPQNGVERPSWPICVHFCIPTVVRNGATVYTNAPKRRRESIYANLCTFLRRHSRSNDPRKSRNSVHKCPETASRGRFRQSVYTPASPPGGEGHATGAVTQPPTHTSSRSLRYLRIYIVRDRGAADSNPVVPTMNVHARGLGPLAPLPWSILRPQNSLEIFASM